MIEKYINFLRKNNYSINTIRSYKGILENKNLNLLDIRSIRRYILNSNKITTMHTRYNIIYSYLKWIKDERFKRLKELKIPPIGSIYRPVIKKNRIYKLTSKGLQKELVIRFLFETGIRASEMATVHDISMKTIKVIGKGNKIREIFHNFETTKQINHWKISTKTIRCWVKDVLGDQYTPHSLRRSHATHMILNGANVKTVAQQLGHVKVETTYMYLQLSKEHNIKIYNKHW